MKISDKIVQYCVQAVKELFGTEIPPTAVQWEKTNRDFHGDITIVVFPWARLAKSSPEQTAEKLGQYLSAHLEEMASYNVLKGFLNIEIKKEYYLLAFRDIPKAKNYGHKPINTSSKPYIIEYSSPNTNKPLHLGHIRNNLLGWSVAEILKADGKSVKKVNLINDRGIHICKSMIAWLRLANGQTPESSGMKGDHLVGKYYVRFDQTYKAEIAELCKQGLEKEEAEKQAPILKEAHEMLRKWEAGDTEVIALWKKMNTWVYTGFDETYKKLGVDFDKIYYESQTYLLGKSIVMKALEENILFQKEDGSVWADLSDQGLDQKLLLRADGTSVYMTQDLGTAKERQTDFDAEKLIYVVGNEQNYHFDVLQRILIKMGYSWGKKISHLSYGMVELPEGKMKSREGTVVDADDLMASMEATAKQTSEELGKAEFLEDAQATNLFHHLAMGALKYFILKVDPVKNMLFNPKESIDFNGNTGPFIQYTHARICSLLRKAGEYGSYEETLIAPCLKTKEKEIIKSILAYPDIVSEAAANFSPAIIANYVYDLAKEFNGFYQDTPILREENEELKNFRLELCKQSARILADGLSLLGIFAPEKM